MKLARLAVLLAAALLLGTGLCTGREAIAGEQPTGSTYDLGDGTDVLRPDVGTETTKVTGRFLAEGEFLEFAYTATEHEQVQLLAQADPGLVLRVEAMCIIEEGHLTRAALFRTDESATAPLRLVGGRTYAFWVTALSGTGDFSLEILRQPAIEDAGTATSIPAVVDSATEILRYRLRVETDGSYLISSSEPAGTALFAWDEVSGSLLAAALRGMVSTRTGEARWTKGCCWS